MKEHSPKADNHIQNSNFGLLLTNLLCLQKGLCHVLLAPCDLHNYRQKVAIFSFWKNCRGALLPG